MNQPLKNQVVQMPPVNLDYPRHWQLFVSLTVGAGDSVHAKLAIWSRCSDLIKHFYCGTFYCINIYQIIWV